MARDVRIEFRRLTTLMFIFLVVSVCWILKIICPSIFGCREVVEFPRYARWFKRVLEAYGLLISVSNRFAVKFHESAGPPASGSRRLNLPGGQGL
jgi:hypothetical protein